MMGGEESGAMASMHLPERDGIYADLLLLDLFVRERRPDAGRCPGPSSTCTTSRAPRSTSATTCMQTARPIPRSRTG
ncbi:MAG: hypothetical protein R3C32_06575 [Chloroflexota bacterium]